ncbi:hypothetical protein PQX77_017965, partial [Marasmius sp. AFHP31]
LGYITLDESNFPFGVPQHRTIVQQKRRESIDTVPPWHHPHPTITINPSSQFLFATSCDYPVLSHLFASAFLASARANSTPYALAATVYNPHETLSEEGAGVGASQDTEQTSRVYRKGI